MSVKVDPAHVASVSSSPLYALMSDWKTAVPAALFVAMPFYTSGKLPGFDERMELAMIVMTAGVLMFKGAFPARRPAARRARSSPYRSAVPARPGRWLT